MYCFWVVMWMFKIDWGTTIFSEYVESYPSWWGFWLVNYISVKGALVKSNTWDLGKKSRRGHGEESPMCAVVIEMPCLRLSQRRPSFSHFMFANKGFSVKKSAMWSGSPSQFTAAPWTCSSHCWWFFVSMVCSWRIFPTLDSSTLVLGDVITLQQQQISMGDTDCSDSSAFPDCCKPVRELVPPPSAPLPWLLKESPLFVYIKDCIFSK